MARWTALFIKLAGLTQTGQLGPCIIRIFLGSMLSIPFFSNEWVCPPHSSMIFQLPFTVSFISCKIASTISGERNADKYFITIMNYGYELSISKDEHRL